MELLQALGLDSTILPQFIIFLIAYITLSQLVFKPYLAAYDIRKQATAGNQEMAQQTVLEAQELHFTYETKAREINHQIKTIYDAARKDATKLQEDAIYKAREDADKVVKKTREEIRAAVAGAREELKKTVPELSQAISDRLLGKEVH